MALVIHVLCWSWAIYHSAADSSANDHREHVLFRVVRECDKDGSNEGSSLKARGLDQREPEEIERNGSDGPYGDTSSTWMTWRLKGSRASFMRSNVITLRPPMP
jgi:hypothetical protein